MLGSPEGESPHSYTDPSGPPKLEGPGPLQLGPLLPRACPFSAACGDSLSQEPKGVVCIPRVSFAYYLGNAFAFPTCSKLQAD